jgi:hypothetical protein
MTAIQAAALTAGQAVQFSDGRIARVAEQDITLSFLTGADMYRMQQPHIVKLEFEADQSIGYLNWSDMSSVSAA